MKKLLLILLMLSLVGCSSIFKKKGKGILRDSHSVGMQPSDPPEDSDPPGEGGDVTPLFTIEVIDEVLYIEFTEDIGWVRLALIDKTDKCEKWGMELDTSLGRFEIEIPSSLEMGIYELRLTLTDGAVLHSETVYIY